MTACWWVFSNEVAVCWLEDASALPAHSVRWTFQTSGSKAKLDSCTQNSLLNKHIFRVPKDKTALSGAGGSINRDTRQSSFPCQGQALGKTQVRFKPSIFFPYWHQRSFLFWPFFPLLHSYLFQGRLIHFSRSQHLIRKIIERIPSSAGNLKRGPGVARWVLSPRQFSEARGLPVSSPELWAFTTLAVHLFLGTGSHLDHQQNPWVKQILTGPRSLASGI